MPAPTDDHILMLLDTIKKGEHLALLWTAPLDMPAARCMVAYLRVSSRRQLDGEGLADQWRACVAYAQRMEWTIIGLYVDPAISGRKEHRPAIDQLKEDARTRRFKFVLFYWVNRMGRNAPAMWATADEVERCGVEVQSATEHFSRNTAAGKLTFNMLASFAQFGSDQLSEVMKDRLTNKAKSGNWVGPHPYGYVRDGKTLAIGEYAPIVAELFERMRTGQETYRTLYESMNARSVPFLHWRDGVKRWERETVRAILKNRAYTGMVCCDGNWYPGNHPAIVDGETFESVQRILAERDRGRGAPRHHPAQAESWLMGRLWCEQCGSKLYHQTSGRTPQPYYRCSGPQRGLPCDAPMVPARMVEAACIHLLQAISLPHDLMAEVIAAAQALIGIPVATVAPTPEYELKALKLAFMNDEFSAAEYERRRAELLNRQQAAQPQMALRLNLERAAALLTDLPTVLAAADAAEKRAIVYALIDRLWIDNRVIVGLAPRAETAAVITAAVGSRGCVRGVPDGFRTHNLLSHSQALCH